MRKSEVGSPKSEVAKKSEVGGQKSEENNSAPDSYRDDIPQSKLNKSDPDSYRDEHPTSEIETQPTANSKLPTEHMEVHHHPEVEKKTFKQYLLEGLMIFIAVTMGFFAESLREHIADNKKEKEIVIALQKDLRKDTAELNVLINSYLPVYNRWVDSLHYDVDKLPIKGNERKITRALFNATVWHTYVPTEMALNLLKNSGSFDLVENKKAKAAILMYNGATNEYIKYSEFVTGVQHSVDTSTMALIDIRVSRKLLGALSLNSLKGLKQTGFLEDNQIPNPVIFKNYNKAAFINYIRKVDQVDVLIADMLTSYKGLLMEDVQLLKVLKETYHLEDE